MIASREELVRELAARGLAAAGGAPAASAEPSPGRPWYVSLLLGTAGWFAGIFVLIIAAMLFHPDKGPTAFILGAVLLAAAWGLFKVDRDGAFVSQLALALSIAGQFAVIFGLGENLFRGSNGIAAIALGALVLQAALVVAMPNRLHRTMSALFACLAWAVFVRYGLWDDAPFPGRGRGKPPPSFGLALAGWAIVWLPLAGVLYIAIRREAEWMARGWQAVVRPAAVGVIVAVAVTTLVSQPFETFPWVSHGEPGAGGRAIWPLLSATAALGALVAAFALGHPGITWLCVAAALAHLSHFYYAMGTTLLTKSLTMIAAGVILLWTARSMGRHE
jgi:hypothetical protein